MRLIRPAFQSVGILKIPCAICHKNLALHIVTRVYINIACCKQKTCRIKAIKTTRFLNDIIAKQKGK